MEVKNEGSQIGLVVGNKFAIENGRDSEQFAGDSPSGSAGECRRRVHPGLNGETEGQSDVFVL
jgi:hypothetical protein